MAKPVPEDELNAIEDIVRRHPDGSTAQDIADALAADVPRRTLQYRLKRLVDAGRIVQRGARRWAKYFPPAAGQAPEETRGEALVPVSDGGAKVLAYLRRPVGARNPVGYNRTFLDGYRPNATAYLSPDERARLARTGQPPMPPQPAGTYVKQILSRLLIDLSWNSSRLEGNTYSLLDTRRLIEFGEEAAGRERLEAQMILNHKDAIAFLAESADDIGFNRYTILNLHAMLASNLLPDETSGGRLRHIAVGIEQSAFHPLEAPQVIEECFDQILATAEAIDDPFEQAFFVMVHLPYLQPFDDVNKRVSRLAANIPFIRHNLAPLSFTDVPRSTYTEAVLGVYEMNSIDLLKDVFIWAYERSAARYAAVRQSLGEPDPFRLKHRAALRAVVGEIVRAAMDRRAALAHIAARAKDIVVEAEEEPFREMAESDLLSLHAGNYARYRIRPSEFKAWQAAWSGESSPHR